MFKSLRSWFVWRFSLRRLVIATVFLGAVVGLNMRKIGPDRTLMLINEWGKSDIWSSYYFGWPLPCVEILQLTESPEARDTILAFKLPLTHQTYHLQGLLLLSKLPERMLLRVNAILDALFALTVLFLILFLQIPRRKAP